MKTLFRILIAGFALSAATVRAEVSTQAWLETYYLSPQPAELPRAIRALSDDDDLAKPGRTALAIGFISTVFAQHPDRVDGWLRELSDLSDQGNRLVAAALWQSGNPMGPDALRALSQQSPLRSEMEHLARTPSQPIIYTSVLSTSSMNLQWGAFLASGDEKHIIAVLEAIGRDQPGLDQAAKLSLAYHAAAHPRVMEICRAQLDRQPEEVRGVLRAALSAAEAKPRS